MYLGTVLEISDVPHHLGQHLSVDVTLCVIIRISVVKKIVVTCTRCSVCEVLSCIKQLHAQNTVCCGVEAICTELPSYLYSWAFAHCPVVHELQWS
jgi:hypothetical protein